MLTKAVEKDVIDKHMGTLGIQFRDGRNKATPSYTGKDDGSPEVI